MRARSRAAFRVAAAVRAKRDRDRDASQERLALRGVLRGATPPAPVRLFLEQAFDWANIAYQFIDGENAGSAAPPGRRSQRFSAPWSPGLTSRCALVSRASQLRICRDRRMWP